jgi:hypothetical protein
VRRGGRMTLYVDLDVPEAPEHRVTIACTHWENRTKPKIRRQQMEELLKEVQDIPNPVIIAGDMNTSGSDSIPTSVENMLYKRYGSLDFWTTKGIPWTTGVGIVYSGTKAALKLTGIQYRIDPTSANIPGASPNLERGFFTALEKFRFSTGKAIDFAVFQSARSMGKPALLPTLNSNSIGFSLKPISIRHAILKDRTYLRRIFRILWLI